MNVVDTNLQFHFKVLEFWTVVVNFTCISFSCGELTVLNSESKNCCPWENLWLISGTRIRFICKFFDLPLLVSFHQRCILIRLLSTVYNLRSWWRQWCYALTADVAPHSRIRTRINCLKLVVAIRTTGCNVKKLHLTTHPMFHTSLHFLWEPIITTLGDSGFHNPFLVVSFFFFFFFPKLAPGCPGGKNLAHPVGVKFTLSSDSTDEAVVGTNQCNWFDGVMNLV
jgi:hypothetical protein